MMSDLKRNLKFSPNTVIRTDSESPYHKQMMEKVKKAMARYVYLFICIDNY